MHLPSLTHLPYISGRHWLSTDRENLLSDRAVGSQQIYQNCKNEQLIISEQGVAYSIVGPTAKGIQHKRVRRSIDEALQAHPVFGG